MEDPKQLAVIFSVLYIAMETIKVLVVWITKNFKKDEVNKNTSKLSVDEREWLKSLYDWHNKEYDGKKIWYVPRNLEVDQREILNVCMLINNSQNKMSDNQEKIAKILHTLSHEFESLKEDLDEVKRELRDLNK